jgi:hypothetical protein
VIARIYINECCKIDWHDRHNVEREIKKTSLLLRRCSRQNERAGEKFTGRGGTGKKDYSNV